MGLKILGITDLHHYTKEEILNIANIEYDVCLLLGDISEDALSFIKEINDNKPIYGVCGNHDTWDAFKNVGIEDIHCKAVTVGKYTIAGFGGSHRYKNTDFAMMTQEESLEVAKSVPKADILISHDAPYKLFGENPAHQGLKGVSWYIKEHQPKLNLCGHYHEEQETIYKSCLVKCIYRFHLYEIDETFLHNTESKTTIQNDFNVPENSHSFIIGKSGSGKSFLPKLFKRKNNV